jgi:hypothetical protein
MMAAAVLANARESSEGISVDDVAKFLNAYVCDDEVRQILDWLLGQAQLVDKLEAELEHMRAGGEAIAEMEAASADA